MPIQVCSLNSGSNANCYYVGNNSEAVLIDAGLSLREFEKRMKHSFLDAEKVKAIFISHEHIDHITGLPAISKKYQLPVYITEATLKNCKVPIEAHLVKSFSKNDSVFIGGLAITPFQKNHDAADAHSFIVNGCGINVGVITDLGIACKRAIKYFSQCHVAFLEANYCPDMLAAGNYPYHLQKRISGGKGHLSNYQALDLFLRHRSAELELLILSHLSKNNNKPEIVKNLFEQHAADVKIEVASRYEVGPVFSFEDKLQIITPKPNKKKFTGEQQLTLFE